MARIICKMCGGLLELPEGITFGECPCCGNQTTFPTIPDAATESLCSDAERFRQSKDFEKAATAFSSVIARNSDDPDAYWGRLLSRFGIVYAEDPETHVWGPVRHIDRTESFVSDPDYLKILKLATDSNRSYYESEGKRINEAVPPVAQDAPANAVMTEMTLRPPVPPAKTEMTLRPPLPRPTAAQTAPDAAQTAPYAAQTAPDAPQTAPEAAQTAPDAAQSAPAAAQTAPDAASPFSPSNAEKNETLQSRPKPEQSSVSSGGAAKQNPSFDFGAPDIEKIMRRCSILMEQRDWTTAREHCQRALDSDPENPDLYLMLCMINHQIPTQADLENCNSDLSADRNFQTALKLYPPERREQLQKIQEDSRFNFYLSKCLSAKGLPNIAQLAWYNAPLSEDADFQAALRTAPPERREELLRIQYGQLDYFLNQIKTKYGVSDVSQTPVPLETESLFQMALKSAPPERWQEVQGLRRKQSDYFLGLCKKTRNVFDESGLGLGDSPLANDPNFQMAVQCAPPERRAELQSLLHGQADSYLWKCLSTNHLEKETDLVKCPVPLADDRNFQMAMKYASPEQREYLKQIQSEQSDYFLRKCMKKNQISDVSWLHKCPQNLAKDSSFKNAMKCASPEQLKRLRWILVRNGVQRVKRGVKRLVTYAILLAILGGLVWSWFLFPEIGAMIDIPEKQYEVAENYLTGLYFYDFIYTREQDEKKAVEWYLKAAEQGLPRAQVRLAICYQNRVGVDVDMSSESKIWFERGISGLKDSAKDGDPEDQFLLGLCYMNGYGVGYDRDEGEKWLRRAAKQGYAKAQYAYGARCCGSKDAVSWYRKAANKGFAPAQYSLGEHYLESRKNVEKAMEWFRKSARKGVVPAMLELAHIYEEGIGEVDADEELAFKWYLRAAKKGIPSAQYEIGRRYENGDGVKENEKEALKWYRKAAEKDYWLAKDAVERLEEDE